MLDDSQGRVPVPTVTDVVRVGFTEEGYCLACSRYVHPSK
jgi:hypothetical protein